MNLLFHTLVGAGIGHVAASRMEESRSESQGLLIGLASVVALAFHGILDGLKHGYPLASGLDAGVSMALAAAWCWGVRRRFVGLFSMVFLASVLPDLVDQGPGLLKSVAGIDLPLSGLLPVFPWHWHDGSGSMYPGTSTAAARFQNLDLGSNRTVSWVNHALVVVIALACIASNPGVFRRGSRLG